MREERFYDSLQEAEKQGFCLAVKNALIRPTSCDADFLGPKKADVYKKRGNLTYIEGTNDLSAPVFSDNNSPIESELYIWCYFVDDGERCIMRTVYPVDNIPEEFEEPSYIAEMGEIVHSYYRKDRIYEDYTKRIKRYFGK